MAVKKGSSGGKEIARILRKTYRSSATHDALRALLSGQATACLISSDGEGGVKYKGVPQLRGVAPSKLSARRKADLAILKAGLNRSGDGLFVEKAPFDEMWVEQAPFEELWAEQAPFSETWVEQAPFDEMFVEKAEVGFGKGAGISTGWRWPLERGGLTNPGVIERTPLVKLFTDLKKKNGL
ncbi:MAG: hypothetical protein AAFY88_16100 [Acidobacteriota bacterium]